MKWPWSRNKPIVEVQVPPEVEEYYQSTQKDRRGMAWLLAFATLILTILIAVLIFFTGRWAYNAIFGDDDNSAGTVQVEEQSSGSDDSEASAADDALESPLSENSEASDQEAESLPSGPSNDSSAPTTTPSPQTPTTGPSDIPRTGPTEE